MQRSYYGKIRAISNKTEDELPGDMNHSQRNRTFEGFLTQCGKKVLREFISGNNSKKVSGNIHTSEESCRYIIPHNIKAM